MFTNEPNPIDPRLIGSMVRATHGGLASPTIIPGRGPVSMPVSMPGPPGQGGYNRYREMTLEEMLLENRVVFLVGEINHVSASRVIMQLFYLENIKRDTIRLYINSPGGVVDDTLAMYDVMQYLGSRSRPTASAAPKAAGRSSSWRERRASALSFPTPR